VAIALAAGVSMPEAAALARHANARVTAQVYAGLSDEGGDGEARGCRIRAVEGVARAASNSHATVPKFKMQP
jgi:hypothetical protein